MSKLGKNVEWVPDGAQKASGPSPRRILVIVSLILVGWIAFSYWLVEYGESNGSLVLGESDGPHNVVKMKNDSTRNVYFVPCDDLACRELPRGNHPSDFNLVTPGNSQELEVTRTKETVVTYGVFDGSRSLQGCLSFRSTKQKLEATSKTLTESMASCDDTGDDFGTRARET